ncbi:uncharacterized protein EV420DRAFT_202127 [Desarmillaria tabescens]|uniref:Uncharacterized protein n=1 Tax=Armillaria tabescens TaxID=1929756 RepID=A0AA39J6Y7_ARMTA|nr:uncharacterized protein EV420DRAFT_202127 [Desarmillaria tabescens]KAK0437287.1 hypothetical protein EV420DRAFT_202127 [Desarmillaria tabescens]
MSKRRTCEVAGGNSTVAFSSYCLAPFFLLFSFRPSISARVLQDGFSASCRWSIRPKAQDIQILACSEQSHAEEEDHYAGGCVTCQLNHNLGISATPHLDSSPMTLPPSSTKTTNPTNIEGTRFCVETMYILPASSVLNTVIL